MVKLSIILPVFDEEEMLHKTIARVSEQLSTEDVDFELIVIDDGSNDKTWEIITELSIDQPQIRGISLSRNFGKEHAMMAGLKYASGDIAIVMDGDLQHPASVIPLMLKKWRDTNCDVVNAVKTGRKNESASGSVVVKLFYRIYQSATGISLKGASDFKLLNRRVIDAYVSFIERDLFFRGLISWLGFHQETVEFEVDARRFGQSKWNPFQRLLMALNATTSFSSLPLQLVTFTGVIFLFGAIALSFHTLYQWYIGTALEGFTTIILLLLFIGAVLMISLGIIGQYIARIYSEIKHRPVFLVKKTLNIDSE